MIFKKINKPTAPTKNDYDNQLWDELEGFSYDTLSFYKMFLLASKPKITELTANATLDATNLLNVVFIDATSGNVTVTLPTIANAGGKLYWLNRRDASANTVTIDGSGAETINGQANFTLTQYVCKNITPNSTEWGIL